MIILQWSCLGFTASFGGGRRTKVAGAAGLTGICSPNHAPKHNLRTPKRFEESSLMGVWRSRFNTSTPLIIESTCAKLRKKFHIHGRTNYSRSFKRSWVVGSFPVSPHSGPVYSPSRIPFSSLEALVYNLNEKGTAKGFETNGFHYLGTSPACFRRLWSG